MREEIAKKAARICSLYQGWCRGWGLYQNMRAATEGAQECADAILVAINLDLPDDDEEAECAIFKALETARGGNHE